MRKMTRKIMGRSSHLGLALLVLGCLTQPGRAQQISNPYQGVDWGSWTQHQANLHTHTSNSDGDSTSLAVIKAYRDSGYTILAITDHSKVTWPWPVSYPGMLAIQGNELSRYHDIGSLFSDYDDRNSTGEAASIAGVQSKGGLAIMNHPKPYINQAKYPSSYLSYATLSWYANLFNTYSNLVGMEVFNSSNWTTDTTHWDNILNQTMPARPVWGFGNDDMHSFNEIGVSRNIIPLPELTTAAVKSALQSGAFYFGSQYTVSSSRRGRLPRINAIVHDQTNGTLTITTREGSGDAVTWHTNQGRRVHAGNTINYRTLASSIGSYLRAQVKGVGGSVFTQPFAFRMTAVSSSQAPSSSRAPSSSSIAASSSRPASSSSVVAGSSSGGCSKVLVTGWNFNAVQGSTTLASYQENNHANQGGPFATGDLVVVEGRPCSEAVAVAAQPASTWNLYLQAGYPGASGTNVRLEKVTWGGASSSSEESSGLRLVAGVAEWGIRMVEPQAWQLQVPALAGWSLHRLDGTQLLAGGRAGLVELAPQGRGLYLLRAWDEAGTSRSWRLVRQ